MKRLGDYELLRKIGSGGMAEVWMGRRAALAGASKAVAIKLLARDLLDDPSYRQMFLDEARLSMLLTNSNVVQVFDVGEIDGECFMVMEWVDGLNLSELTRKIGLQGETLPLGVAAHVIGEVLRALAYAHGLHHEGSQATIVHRDVSPHNVLVSVSGEVKLADFGVARLAREETSGLHVKGKLRYMAPEQLRGRSRDPTVDLYAVGAILHELIEGRRFRQTADEGDLYSMVLNGEYPPLTRDVPDELRRLHAGLLQPDPQRRIPSADEALELLYGWAGYRNSSIELGRLIRSSIGVDAPRSGIINTGMIASGPTSAAPTNSVPTKAVEREDSGASAAPTVPRKDASDAITKADAADSGPVDDRGATETHTWVDPGDAKPEADATAVIVGPAPVAARAPVSSMLIVVALTLGLSFGVFGLGFPLGWWGGGVRAVAEADTAAKQDADGSQLAIAEDEAREDLTPKDDAAIDAPVEVEAPEVEAPEVEAPADETPEDETLENAKPEAEKPEAEKKVVKAAKPKVDGPPASVRFAAGDFPYVWVKVGKGKDAKEHVLEPTADLKLAAGEHPVYLREPEGQKWKFAGRIKVEPGKSYHVKMKKPAKLSLTRR
jgi:serine/threonine protein kinase